MAIGTKFEKNTLSNDTKSINSQCKVVIYQWAQEGLPGTSSNSTLAKTNALDISSQILGFNYRKNMADAAGSFTFRLSNSPGVGTGDWKDIIKRGTWCVIYLSQDGELVTTKKVQAPDRRAPKQAEAKKIRCIGYIDRVAVTSTMDEKGAFDVTYEVSGRDYGVVYEDTSIWHNLFKFDQIMLQALGTSQLNITGSAKIDEVLRIVHGLFYDPQSVPGAKPNDDNSLTSIALQWLMPRDLLRDIGAGSFKEPFWGKVDALEFSKTEAGLAVENPTDYLSGNAWDQLKQISSPALHELFTETNDNGFPKLVFRPIPFAIDKRAYPNVGKFIKFYKDLSPIVSVPAIDVIDFNLGEENHSRYNSFLVTVSTGLINTEDNVSALQGSRFPFNNQDSIKRHGFRPMHVTVDTIVKNAELGNGKSNPVILREFNEVMYDYWNNAVFAETGSASIIGNNLIKVGKALKFGPGTPYVNGKRYYIEGYADEFMVEENGAAIWTQTIELTRGFSEEDLKNKSGFSSRDTDFTAEGEYTSSGGSTGKG